MFLPPKCKQRHQRYIGDVVQTFAPNVGINLLLKCLFRVFDPAGIELVLNTRVASVSEGRVTVVDKTGASCDIPFGACVWSTGIAMSPLAQQLKELFPQQQTHAR